MANRERKPGVLLLNLGGPERLEDVGPFLRALFSDPAILPIPWPRLRRLVARAIAAARCRTSQGYYAKIGGGSPLRRSTEEQARALEEALRSRGVPAEVYVGMSYSPPTIAEAVARIVADGIGDLVVLPLYPQFSTTTTAAALRAVREALAAEASAGLRVRVVREWFDHPRYVEALAASIRESLGRFSDPRPERVHLLYTAHAIPERRVEAGDPYLEQTRATVACVNRALGDAHPWTLSFQSKIGPVRWLKPATDAAIEELGRRGTAQVLAVAVSFVSDHVETLYEIDILYRERAAACGIREFYRAPALGCRREFIEALADLVETAEAPLPSEGELR
jgi:ferrochelatase